MSLCFYLLGFHYSDFSEMGSNNRCKLPLKYLIKCCSSSVFKVAGQLISLIFKPNKTSDQLELELTDVTFTLGIVGTAGWKRTFQFNVMNCEAITSRISTESRAPFLRCPVSGKRVNFFKICYSRKTIFEIVIPPKRQNLLSENHQLSENRQLSENQFFSG